MNMDRRSFLNRTTLAAGAFTLAKTWAAPATGDSSSPVIETSAGKIRGTMEDKVSAFRGVPYGASTAGSGRFMPPEKPHPWTGVKDTVELGHRSPQGASTLIPEVAAVDAAEPAGEDCLVLNVWTPSANAGHKRPVMVWLHGGGFTSGSGGFNSGTYFGRVPINGKFIRRSLKKRMLTLCHPLTIVALHQTGNRLNLFREDHHSVEQRRRSEGAARSPAPFSGNDFA